MAKKLTDTDRARLARDWMDSSETQEEFCARRGCSPRALRQYVATYSAGQRPVARARAIIERAIGQLHGLLAALDAEEARRNAKPDYADEESGIEPDRHAGPAHACAGASVTRDAERELERDRAAVDVDEFLRSVCAEVAGRSPSPGLTSGSAEQFATIGHAGADPVMAPPLDGPAPGDSEAVMPRPMPMPRPGAWWW